MKRAAIAAALSLVVAAEAHAEEPSPKKEPAPVVVLVYRARDPFGIRLEGELRSSGMRVLARPHLTHTLPAGTIAVATVFGAPRPRVEIRMGSHPADDSDPDALVDVESLDEDLKSTKAAEQVRAAIALFVKAQAEHVVAAPLDETPPKPVPAVSDMPAPKPEPERPPLAARNPEPALTIETVPFVPRAIPPAKPRAPIARRLVGLSVGMSAIVGAQGAGWDVVASAVLSPVGWLHIEPFVTIPFAAATLESQGGSADLYAGFAGARVGFTVFEQPILRLDVGGGFAGVWLRAVGDAAAGYVGSTEDGFTAATMLDVTPSVHLTRGLRLVPRASLGVALPPPELVFDGETVGTWGAPFGELGIALDITVFP